MHIVRALHETAVSDTTASPAYTDALIEALATGLVHRHGEVPERPRGRTGRLSERCLRRVTAYVEAHLAEPIPVDELAALAHCSSAHFSRLFRDRTGLTPHRYHLEQRLSRARELLLTDDSSIAEIALAVGFSSQSHLSRRFGQRYGTTPGAVRRR